jgi:hypothetical protein
MSVNQVRIEEQRLWRRPTVGGGGDYQCATGPTLTTTPAAPAAQQAFRSGDELAAHLEAVGARVRAGDAKIERPQCWGCGCEAERGTHVRKIGWHVRYRTTDFKADEVYCPACFDLFGWNDDDAEDWLRDRDDERPEFLSQHHYKKRLQLDRDRRNRRDKPDGADPAATPGERVAAVDV